MLVGRDMNPFTPSFGVTPPLLVGRAEELAEIEAALDASIGDPFRAVKVTGLRGSGKTVFLNGVEDLARARGWAVISESARPGLVDRLTDTVLPALLSAVDPSAVTSTTTGAAIGIGVASLSGSRETTQHYQPRNDLRGLLSRLADLLQSTDAGVLISVDELNSAAAADLQILTQVVQHCFREGRNVAFVAAGLPLEVDAMLDQPGTTFLRRAEHVVLGVIAEDHVRRGLLEPIDTWGGSISPGALDTAAAGTKGYPFLLQAIGHRLWATSQEGVVIPRQAATAAVAHATRRVGELVMGPELRGLSAIDRSYLAAMAVDAGPSRTGEVAERIEQTPQYAGTYRRRLIRAGLIVDAGHGWVDFALPTMRDYLREHVATESLE